MSKRLFIGLGILTIIGFSAIGAVLIYYILNKPPLSVFQHGVSWHLQLPVGIAYGVLSALIGWALVRSKLLTRVRNLYVDLVKELNLSMPEIIFISLCAGIGEEMLFRAALQPMAIGYTSFHAGIWITSVVFVAIHGYLNPMNWRLSIYGLLMTLIIAGIGYMYEYIGLIAAMSAHFAIDVVLLRAINKNRD